MQILLITWIFLLTFIQTESYTCTLNNEETRIKCENGYFTRITNLQGGSKIFDMYRSNSHVFDLNELIEICPKLESITLEHINYTKIIFPKKENHIQELTLKYTGLKKIDGTFLSQFSGVKSLNFQQNQIESIDLGNFSTEHLKFLALSGNKWNCSKGLDWIFQLNQTIVKDLKNLTCFGEPHAGKSLLSIATFMKNIKSDCPEACICSLPKVVIQPDTDHLEPIIEVNCSQRDFEELPKTLPARAKILRLERNQIQDLSPLITNPVYRSVIDLYLDNNQIDSIDVLEGSYWLKHFRVLSLSGNKLSEIPTYALDNALMQNLNMPNAVKITLGMNPWRCDCVFTPVFQEMLQKFASEIKDLPDVKCSYVEDDENSMHAIIELTRSSVCRMDSEYSIRALDLLNAILASLILLILGKLAYDYYFYKKTGRLPWIVTKIP